MEIKLLIKEFIPPILIKAYHFMFKLHQYREEQYGFFGDYASWSQAKQICTGYDADVIIDRVKETALQVKLGNAVYERDSVLFDRVQYSFPLLAGLLKVALENKGKLCVLDFGGALGSSYFQCRKFLGDLEAISWNIIEQEKFVDCGKKHFEDEELKFFYNFKECLNATQPHVILLSGLIQCLEEPYVFMEKVISYHFSYIIIDRTAFTRDDSERLTVQKVPPSIYPASYPAWFLSKQKFLNLFQNKYKLVVEFDGADRVNVDSEFKGFIFQKLEIGLDSAALENHG